MSAPLLDKAKGVQKTWLSLAEAGALIGAGREQTKALIETGKLPGYRWGKQYKVKAEDMEAFIASSRIQPVQKSEEV